MKSLCTVRNLHGFPGLKGKNFRDLLYSSILILRQVLIGF